MSEDDVDAAMRLGFELNLVAPSQSLSGADAWILTAKGLSDLRRYDEWVDLVRERALAELLEKARTGIDEVPDVDTARLWLNKLVEALIHGIRQSQAAYLGDVESLVTGHVLPRALDRHVVLEGLRSVDDLPIREFLEAAALSALDPLDPFGNELVSHITTGCILHAFIAGRTRQVVLDRIGRPEGVRVILDTPVLLQLVGPRRLQDPLWRAITLASQSGWDVVVPHHSLDELRDLLERDVPVVAGRVREAIERRVSSELYATLVDEQLPSLFVESLRDGTYRQEELAHAHEGLAERLESAGVAVRDHYNDQDAHYVDRCREALSALVGDKRSEQVIDRDAQTMAMAWRKRRRHEPTRRNKWPAAWVVTFDRKMGPAFERLTRGRGDLSLTLSPSQWMTLVSVGTEAATTEELASMAATQLIDEAMWQLPMRFSPEVALDLASTLSPDRGASETDLRVAQLSLTSVLDDADELRTGVSIAADVLEIRTQRLAAIQAAETSRARTEAARATAAATHARNQAAIDRARSGEAAAQLVLEQGRSEQASATLAWRETQLRRVLLAGGVGFLLAILAIGVVIASESAWATAATVAGAAAYGFVALRWCTRRDARLRTLVISGIVEVAGVVGAASDIAAWIKDR